MVMEDTELADLETQVHQVFKKQLGYYDSSLLTATMSAINQGMDRAGLEDSLGSLLDEKKSAKLVDEVWGIVSEYWHEKQQQHEDEDRQDSRKRGHGEDGEEDEYSDYRLERKKQKYERRQRQEFVPPQQPEQEGGEEQQEAQAAEAGGEENAAPALPLPTPEQIQEMLKNTQKMIQERKKQLKVPEPQPALSDKTKQIAALQLSIANKLSKVAIPQVELPTKPQALILDSAGRTVDASGQEVQLSQHIPTLKANLRAQKREEFGKHIKEIPKTTVDESEFFDPRVSIRSAGRNKRTIKFHEAGKFQAEANRIRMKTQLEKLQSEISQIARKTGISSATQLAKLVPKGDRQERVPDVEWWDQLLIGSSGYEHGTIRDGAISNLIEHPIQLKPMESRAPVHIPVFLTKKERKKLRRQNRREAWKEKQDKIRLGLIQPDEPKVKMSNLMRVLGNDAVLDPTKVEAHVKAQMAKRKADHEAANAERKLTPAQKKEKSAKKVKEDTTGGVHVTVYRVKNLHSPAKKWKIEKNAQQLYMTGAVVLYQDVNVVVVEGGPKQMKKYKQLMLNRIKWNDETYQDKDGTEHENNCELVWEGQKKQRDFGEMKFKMCPTESFAREHFKKAGVEHYWDQAYSAAVIAATDDV